MVRVIPIPTKEQWQHWCEYCANCHAQFEIILNSMVDVRVCKICITELYKAIGDKL